MLSELGDEASLVVLLIAAFQPSLESERPLQMYQCECPAGQFLESHEPGSASSPSRPLHHERPRTQARTRVRLSPVNRKSPKRCVSSYSGKEVPCRDGSSWWSNARDCYVSLADPQPAKSDPEWEGHRTGAIYECYSPGIVGTRMYTFWSATSPAGPAAPPDPRALALRGGRDDATAGDRYWNRAGGSGRGVSGSSGCRRGCGSPIRASTRGVRSLERPRPPGTASQRRRRSSVWCGRWATAERLPAPSGGHRMRIRLGSRSSPDCGHTYTRQGTYTVRATSYWRVTWAGIGQSGTIPLDFTRTAVITIGEAQVLIR